MNQSIIKGQRVRVRNQRLNGETFIEGYPKVVKVIEVVESQGMVACEVIFPDDDKPVFRWVVIKDQVNVIQD